MSAERFLGAVGLSRMTVRHGDTAIALGSGDVPVLGTPAVIALAENATIAALAEFLEQSETTVGVRIELDHSATASIGDEVVATSKVSSLSGEKIIFEVECHSGNRLIAKGVITRVLIDRVSFIAKAAAEALTRGH
ncbi:MAG: thioesterase [Actinobacteria bacterium]|uniref:Thioesterase n=1 Tax=Candidatus Fonsibacter lacus TaxID=2576439 RepID=A0A965LKF7_9PROT|nr:thioesterase [Candidatus Fonsibacter lacus]